MISSIISFVHHLTLQKSCNTFSFQLKGCLVGVRVPFGIPVACKVLLSRAIKDPEREVGEQAFLTLRDAGCVKGMMGSMYLEERIFSPEVWSVCVWFEGKDVWTCGGDDSCYRFQDISSNLVLEKSRSTCAMELTTEYCFGDFILEVLAVSKFATENSDSDGSSSSSDSSEEVDDFGSSASEQEEESQGEYDQDAQARDRSSVGIWQARFANPTKPLWWNCVPNPVCA